MLPGNLWREPFAMFALQALKALLCGSKQWTSRRCWSTAIRCVFLRKTDEWKNVLGVFWRWIRCFGASSPFWKCVQINLITILNAS